MVIGNLIKFAVWPTSNELSMADETDTMLHELLSVVLK